MAKAQRILNESIPQFKTKEVILTLTPEEAYFLKTLTGSCMGCEKSSLRKLSDSIYYALKQAGIVSEPPYHKHNIGCTSLMSTDLQKFIEDAVLRDNKT